MDQHEDELEQIATWLDEEGFAPDSSQEAQLCLLWRSLRHTRQCLSGVRRDQDVQRAQHLAEMEEVRKSLEQIRVFTAHKDVLAQEIQDENDQLKDQLQQLITLQDAQISEVAKMLYQQGLTELIHSSVSEQVAYLLVERASLLETSADHADPTAITTANNNNNNNNNNSTCPLGTETPASDNNARQSPHKAAPPHGQNSWRRLFGLYKASHNSKRSFFPADTRDVTGGVERRCSRLERDLEEGSRRLAMAHGEIRRLTDELESARLTQKAYEPRLQAAHQEVKKLQKCDEVELRKTRELNDRLDLEIRALRTRVRTLDAEKSSLQQKVVSLQREMERLESALQEQQQQAEQPQLQAVQVPAVGQERPGYQHAAGSLISTQDECEALKKEICETLRCLDNERSKYHEMTEKHRARLRRAKQKCDGETAQRDERIKALERDLSFCSHLLTKEKELVVSIAAENGKLLAERTRLLQQLNEEEHNKEENNLTAALSRCRVDFLEMENKKLGSRLTQVSNQLSVLERSLQSIHSAEELKKKCNLQRTVTSLSVQSPRVMVPQTLLVDTQSIQTKQTGVTSPSHCLTSAALTPSPEMGYLNLASTQRCSDQPASLAALESADSLCS